MAFNETIKESITLELSKRGRSMRWLARELGLGQEYVWRRLSFHERATSEFTPSELEAIAGVLDMPLATLIKIPAPAA